MSKSVIHLVTARPRPLSMGQLSMANFLSTIPLLFLADLAVAQIGEYTALGDSYAAGVGSDGSWSSLNDCYQNNGAYPQQLSRQDDMGLSPYHFQACTGAATQHVDKCQVGNEFTPDDSCHNSSPDGLGFPKFITLTVGGDNVEFADLLQECVYEVCPGECLGCDARVAKTDADIASVTNDGLILETINHAVDVSGVDRANFYVTGYASFWNVDVDCPSFAVKVLPIDHLNSTFRDRMNGQVRALNAAIRAQSDEAGVKYVDVEEKWNGHRWCEEGGVQASWFNGLLGDDEDTISQLYLDIDGNILPNFVEGVFHPTFDGQTAYANNIRNAAGYSEIFTALSSPAPSATIIA